MKASELAKILGGKVEGNPFYEIKKPEPLDTAGGKDTAFIFDKKYDTHKKVGALIASFKPRYLKSEALIIVENPRKAFIKTLKLFEKKPEPPLQEQPRILGKDANIHPEAVIYPFTYIGNRVKIGQKTHIFPFVYIGEDVEIGDNVVIFPHVFIGHNVKIGNNVIIHAGSVLGADGFGFERTDKGYIKIPQIGGIVIEDDVEIGANCTIDRATIGNTIIKKGTKLDDQVHVAHNVKIGEHTVIAAQSGIAGSTEIGKWVMMGGQVGVKDHVKVADNTIVMAQSGISKNTEKGKMYVGSPAKERKIAWREMAYLSRLEELFKRVKKLEQKLEEKNH